MSGVANKLMSAAGGGEPEGAWDLSYAYFDPPESLAANLSTTKVRGGKSVAAEDTAPKDVFFKPDGTKMYVAGGSGRDLNEYSLTAPWNTSAVFVERSNVTFPDTPANIFFKPDGTKFYVAITPDSIIQEYNLSTAWDIRSMSFVQSVAIQSDSLFFKPDGTKMYIRGTSTAKIAEYNLSAAWDISTAVFFQEADISASAVDLKAIHFASNGTVMFGLSSSDNIYGYKLSIAWDISTLSYTLGTYNTATEETAPNGVYLKEEADTFFIVGQTGDTVDHYFISGFSVAAQDDGPTGLFFKPDGTKMYVIGTGEDRVNEYDLGMAWDTSTASFLQFFSVSAQESIPHDVFFKSDGTKMYIVGLDGSDVNEYNLSAAWDVSTASFLQSFSVLAQDKDPKSIFFKPDGTKMYVAGDDLANILEYNLSTAWDVSSASFLQSFSTLPTFGSTRAMSFKGDGTKMFVLSGRTIYEYDLGMAWDVSTSVYSQNFYAVAVGAGEGLFIREDGTKMFVTGTTSDMVFSYTLGVQE